jgi:hypothetical protein
MKPLIARSIDFDLKLIDQSECSKREFVRMKVRSKSSSASLPAVGTQAGNSLELFVTFSFIEKK